MKIAKKLPKILEAVHECVWKYHHRIYQLKYMHLDTQHVIHVLNFGTQSWFLRWKEHPCPLSLELGLWGTLEVPDWGLASWYWFGYGHWSLMYPGYDFLLSVLRLKVQRTSMSYESSFGAFEDAGCSWLGFGIVIWICIWSLVFGTPIFRIMALQLDFEGAKNIHVL